VSEWTILWYVSQNTWTLYAINICAGLALGWVVSRIEKRNLFLNLLIASTALIVLSVIANSDLMRVVLSYGVNFNYLLEKALLPLAAGWIAPFVFLLFIYPEPTQTNSYSAVQPSAVPVPKMDSPMVLPPVATTPKTDEKKCTHCGAMNPTTSKFCGDCGTPLFAPPELLAR
jgi:ribosomal protein L40E